MALSSTFTVDGIEYGVIGGRAAIVTGAEPDVVDLSIPSYVKYGRTGYLVVSVADWAFEDSAIEFLSVPAGVIVGNGAFYNCDSLASAEISEVSRIGVKAFSGCESLADVSVFTDVPQYAFYGCTGLESIVIAESVESIGANAFSGCTELKNVLMAKGVRTIGARAFYGCTGLESIVIAEGVESIGASAFYGCAELRNAEIGEGVRTIGANAFNGCTSLLGISFPSTLESIGDNALAGLTFKYETFNIEPTVDNIAGRVFHGSGAVLNCAGIDVGDTFTDSGLVYRITSLDPYRASVAGYEGSIVTLEVPDTIPYGLHRFDVNAIASNAFYNCRTLTSADLGSVESIGTKAFAYCTGLKEVDLGGSIKTVSAYAFCKCTKLKTVDLDLRAGTLKVLGSYSFYKCPSLENIAIPDTVKNVNDTVFTATFYDGEEQIPCSSLPGYVYKDGKRAAGAEVGRTFECNGLSYQVVSSVPAKAMLMGSSSAITSLVVPETVELDGYTLYVTSVAPQAFYKASKLASVDLGAVESVGTKAFAYCTRLTSIDMGDGLKTVGAYSFFKCSALSSIEIPSTVTTIGSYSFYKCTALSEVDMGDGVRTIGKKAFDLDPIDSISFSSALAKMSDTAFVATFLDVDGNEIEKAATSLAGRSFSGVGDVLREIQKP